jgi:hypothetical protein
MVDDMLDALAGTPALSLLQFAAAKLWDLRDRDRRLLTAESYQAIGGISGALTTHADEVVKRMDAVARTLAEKILRRLVTPERTRATVELSELRQLAPEPADITRVIDLLVAAGLLAVSDSGGSVELVHASLISRWPTLRRLLDENQEDAAFLTELGTAAKQWEARGRPIGLLWRGDALEPARRWYVQRPRELAARDQAFLDAALALARRGRRLRRVALVGSFVTLLAIAAGASVAYFQMRTLKQEARSQAERAETSLRDKLAADAAKAAAETQRTAAEAQRNAAEQQESKAEEATAVAQHREKMTLEELRRTADDLEKRKLELETALRIAGAAKDRAERLSADRKQATDEANAAKVKLGEALAAEKARVKQLEDEKKALSTKLKGE